MLYRYLYFMILTDISILIFYGYISKIDKILMNILIKNMTIQSPDLIRLLE